MPSIFQRSRMVEELSNTQHWDVIVIGGGASGLGIALDAASRGYATLLLEQHDFAKGTSSRSTKLVHGGVRYLANGDIKLVYEALHERGLLQRNAAHLVTKQSFIIPCYSIASKLTYLLGLKFYDLLSGRYSLGKSRLLSTEEVIQSLPHIQTKDLVGGVEYFDAQFDDARLAVNLAQTCIQEGGTVLNYFKVTGLLKEDESVRGVVTKDLETGAEYRLQAKVVVNATGVYVDDILKMDTPGRKPMVRPSRGVHIVIDRSFLGSQHALMIPKTSDGRVLFSIPWHDHLLVGTTDTLTNEADLEPDASQDEVKFILETIQQYLKQSPTEADIRSIFAGLRPLAAPDDNGVKTKEISRSHKIMVSDSGLVTITGGKWTTYRKMAEDTVNKVIEVGELVPVECKTGSLAIHGCRRTQEDDRLNVYGRDKEQIQNLIRDDATLGRKLVEGHSYTEAEVVWAVRNEMARTVEDVLARRLRILFLDAAAALKCAPRVAELVSAELSYNEKWQADQVAHFYEVARHYIFK